MSGWRAGLIALALGGVILAMGWVLNRDGSPSVTTQPGTVDADVILACPIALSLSCDELADILGAGRATYRTGAIAADTLVVAFAADLPADLESQAFAASPIALAVWGERAPTLQSACGSVTLGCLVTMAGTSWEALGGPATWGTFLLGLADPNEGISDLEAWRLVAAADPPDDFGDSVRLRASDDGQLLVDLVLLPSRADAVVASEAAIASQLANARERSGRLAVFYPDPTPYVSISFYGEGRAARNLGARLLEADVQAMLGSLGLRPLTGEAGNLLRDLGTPGAEMPGLTDAEKPALVESWSRLVEG